MIVGFVFLASVVAIVGFFAYNIARERFRKSDELIAALVSFVLWSILAYALSMSIYYEASKKVGAVNQIYGTHYSVAHYLFSDGDEQTRIDALYQCAKEDLKK